MPRKIPEGLGRIARKPFNKQVSPMFYSMKKDPSRVVRWIDYHKNGALKKELVLKTLSQEEKQKLEKLASLYAAITGLSLGGVRSKAVSVFDKFNTLRELILMVANGYSHSLLCFGRGATGKSYTAVEALHQANKRYVLLKGYSSPAAFYNFLYEHRRDLILIDDCDSVFKDITGLNILKAVLETSEERRVSWLTPSPVINVNTFEFEGRIIFLSNLETSQLSAHMEALMTRVHQYNLELSNDDVLAQIRRIALHSDYKKSTKADRLAVFRFLRDKQSSIPSLNLRHYTKALDLFLYSRRKWKDLFMRCLEHSV